eukprot:5047859-Pyramimonas_sp.AAC.1
MLCRTEGLRFQVIKQFGVSNPECLKTFALSSQEGLGVGYYLASGAEGQGRNQSFYRTSPRVGVTSAPLVNVL